MKRLILIGALALASCGSQPKPQPVVQIQRVEVPVAVKCGTDPGPEPVYSDTAQAIEAAPDIFERVKLLLAGRFERMAWNAKLQASRAGCD